MAESDVSRVEAPDAAHAGRYDAFISYARADGAFAIADAEWVFLRDTDDMVAGYRAPGGGARYRPAVARPTHPPGGARAGVGDP
jgi:hypothetical protein